ncbi:MAG: hypothetical protein V3U93_00385 [Alphaproteobacteria bacterium]
MTRQAPDRVPVILEPPLRRAALVLEATRTPGRPAAPAAPFSDRLSHRARFELPVALALFVLLVPGASGDAPPLGSILDSTIISGRRPGAGVTLRKIA